MIAPGENLRVMIVAGEPSGDLHGSEVVKAIRDARPEAEVFGTGGDGMAAAGMELLRHVDELAVLGFSEVIRKIPYFRRLMGELVATVKDRRPHVVVLIDYPGFNLRFARRIRGMWSKVLYYIVPQVWAWNPGRLKKMRGLIDLAAVIFPFEAGMFHRRGIPTKFVGHPLVEGLELRRTREDFIKKLDAPSDGAPVLGLLPGSRKQEVERLLPVMLRTARELRRKVPSLMTVVGLAPGISENMIRQVDPALDQAVYLTEWTYEIMAYSTALVVASGTATLESACFGTPFAIVYKVSRLNYVLGKQLIRIPHIGLANVVAGEEVAPEFIQTRCQPELVARFLQPLLTDSQQREEMRRRLLVIRRKLGTPGAAHRVRDAIFELAAEPSSFPLTEVTAK